MQYEVLIAGTGKTPKITDAVEVEYDVFLLSSQVFDSTKDVGAQVFNIQEMILGWQEVFDLNARGFSLESLYSTTFNVWRKRSTTNDFAKCNLGFIIELIKIVR